MNTLPIVISIIFGCFTVAGTMIGATWALSSKFTDLKISITSLKGEVLTLKTYFEGKFEGLQTVVGALQARIIRLEEEVKRLENKS